MSMMKPSSTTFLLVLFIFLFGQCLAAILHDLIDIRGNNAIREVRILYTTLEESANANKETAHHLIRGRPMFVEIDFVPRYIPQLTHELAVSVILPKQIRSSGSGGPWVLGWHQEKFEVHGCRLCTNTNTSYTMPLTILLPDDGWCAQGRVPTGWKVEALPKMKGETDGTDLIIGVSVDERAQIEIVNAANSQKCKGVNEFINYTLPVHF